MFRALGIIAGVFSLTILAWKGFHFTFGPFLQGVLEYYEDEARSFFAIVEPFLKERLVTLRDYWGWDFQLFPHWKHVFVLMWLYFGADAKMSWAMDRRIFSMFSILNGGAIALVAATVSGVVPLDSSTSNMLMASCAVAGVTAYQIVGSLWDAIVVQLRLGRGWGLRQLGVGLRHTAIRVLLPGAIALLVGTQADKIGYMQNVPAPGLALLAGLLVATAVYAVIRGALFTLELRRFAQQRREAGATTPVPFEYDSWWQGFLQSGSTRLGFDILSVIGIASAVVLLGMAGV